MGKDFVPKCRKCKKPMRWHKGLWTCMTCGEILLSMEVEGLKKRTFGKKP